MACTTVYERGEKACSRAHGTAISRWQLACVCLSVVAITLSLFTLFWVQKIVQDLDHRCGCEVRRRAEEGHSAPVTSLSGPSGLQDVETPDTDPDTIQLARWKADEEEDEEKFGQSRNKRSKGKRDRQRKRCSQVTKCMRNEIRELRQNFTRDVKKMLTRSYVHHTHPDDVAEWPGDRRNVSERETVLSVKVASRDVAERSGDEETTTIQGSGVYLVYGQLTYDEQQIVESKSYNGLSILVISDDQNRNPPKFLTCWQKYPGPGTNAPTSCFTAGVVPLQDGMMINLTATVSGRIFIDREKTFLGAVNLGELPPEPSDGG
ncbi:PREDICTED: uncharacterized protein LOC109482975 isoform X2 [Branchiostoma belcheri]|uniref:Uncharacterized protein LOC109482975 isoform X2 n=1 Tax=Branchiostoma belcheri TaxID=7741 RepID=A0A6P5AHW0_BRABE|nr:PREDICTED: uncharacterized protein LOC109482975 isoform X2 [Branchiostoma belcheri]